MQSSYFRKHLTTKSTNTEDNGHISSKMIQEQTYIMFMHVQADVSCVIYVNKNKIYQYFIFRSLTDWRTSVESKMIAATYFLFWWEVANGHTLFRYISCLLPVTSEERL